MPETAEDLRATVLEPWCPEGMTEAEGAVVVPVERPPLWTRCPALRPEGLRWLQAIRDKAPAGWHVRLAEGDPEDLTVGHIGPAESAALICWRCVGWLLEWVAETEDKVERIGRIAVLTRALTAPERPAALVAACHCVLDAAEQEKQA